MQYFPWGSFILAIKEKMYYLHFFFLLLMSFAGNALNTFIDLGWAGCGYILVAMGAWVSSFTDNTIFLLLHPNQKLHSLSLKVNYFPSSPASECLKILVYLNSISIVCA